MYADKGKNLSVMSIGFLLPSRDDAVIFRGPKKTAMIQQVIQSSVGRPDTVVVPVIDVKVMENRS